MKPAETNPSPGRTRRVNTTSPAPTFTRRSNRERLFRRNCASWFKVHEGGWGCGGDWEGGGISARWVWEVDPAGQVCKSRREKVREGGLQRRTVPEPGPLGALCERASAATAEPPPPTTRSAFSPRFYLTQSKCPRRRRRGGCVCQSRDMTCE